MTTISMLSTLLFCFNVLIQAPNDLMVFGDYYFFSSTWHLILFYLCNLAIYGAVLDLRVKRIGIETMSVIKILTGSLQYKDI